VVLVTDSGTRQPKKKTYFLACGRLGPRTAEVGEAAWRAFRIAVAGARDMQPGVRRREGRDPGELRPTSLVMFDGRPIGRRRVVTGRLWEGDVIWVRTRDDGASRTVAELSLAALWRHPGWHASASASASAGQDPAGRRVPPALLGCRDPRSLCPTCRVFGSADPEARERDAGARQRSYAGHVRFGDACTERPVDLEPVQRAPLGAPRPGAGQFYLSYADPSPASSRDRKPTREWGSDPDAERPRPLRGRKFYWHADPAAQQPPRHEAREHQRTRPDQTESELVTTRYLAPAGTTLRQRVTFDNLSRAELGGLLAAFDPRQALAGLVPKGRRLLVRLGGGKPLGLGSCTATVSGLRVWTAASRYGGAPEAAPDPDAYLREFAEDCPPEIRENTWPALAAVLAEGTVDPARVWYPPGAHWPDRQDDLEEFDKPFAFFTASSGMFIKPPGRQRQLVPLPDPASGDQSLPIMREQDLQ
jgi:CRISPR-associated protein (TIGR03986 family)